MVTRRLKINAGENKEKIVSDTSTAETDQFGLPIRSHHIELHFTLDPEVPRTSDGSVRKIREENLIMALKALEMYIHEMPRAIFPNTGD